MSEASTRCRYSTATADRRCSATTDHWCAGSARATSSIEAGWLRERSHGLPNGLAWPASSDFQASKQNSPAPRPERVSGRSGCRGRCRGTVAGRVGRGALYAVQRSEDAGGRGGNETAADEGQHTGPHEPGSRPLGGERNRKLGRLGRPRQIGHIRRPCRRRCGDIESGCRARRHGLWNVGRHGRCGRLVGGLTRRPSRHFLLLVFMRWSSLLTTLWSCSRVGSVVRTNRAIDVLLPFAHCAHVVLAHRMLLQQIDFPPVAR